MISEVKEVKVPILTITERDFMCKSKEKAQKNLRMLSDFIGNCTDVQGEFKSIEICDKEKNILCKI